MANVKKNIIHLDETLPQQGGSSIQIKNRNFPFARFSCVRYDKANNEALLRHRGRTHRAGMSKAARRILLLNMGVEV